MPTRVRAVILDSTGRTPQSGIAMEGYDPLTGQASGEGVSNAFGEVVVSGLQEKPWAIRRKSGSGDITISRVEESISDEDVHGQRANTGAHAFSHLRNIPTRFNHGVMKDGVLQGVRTQVNFTGSGVASVTDDPSNDKVDVEVSGGNGGSSPPFTDTTSIVKGSGDTTKQMRIEADQISASTVRVLTMPDQDVDLTPNTGTFPAASHAARHTDGSDDIQDATTSQKGICQADGTHLTASSGVLSLIDNGVTNAKLTDMAQNRFKMRVSSGSGDPEDATAAQARGVLNVEDGADATDADNVDAAGAVMHSDISGTGLVNKTASETYTVKTAPSGDVVGTTDAQTLSSKTLTTPTIGDLTNAQHDHSSTSKGGSLASKYAARSFKFQFPQPSADSDRVMIIESFPFAGTLQEVYAVCENGTNVTFSLVTRPRATPWSSSGQTVNVSSQTATTTGNTKTIANSTLAQNSQMFCIIEGQTGSASDLIISGYWTVN